MFNPHPSSSRHADIYIIEEESGDKKPLQDEAIDPRRRLEYDDGVI